MYATTPYRDNVPHEIKLPAIVLFLVLQSFVFGITSASAIHISSFYGLEPDTVLWFAQISSIGSVAFIPLYFRLSNYFRKRQLVFILLISQLCISLVCYNINYMPFLLISSFFMGCVKLSCLVGFLSLLVGELPIIRHRAIFYAVIYTISRGSGELADILINNYVVAYKWELIYLVSAFASVLCLVITCLLMHGQKHQRRIPLYRMDWMGLLLFSVISLLISYILNFGKTKDWFASADIIYATIAVLVLLPIFVYLQTHAKRPFWNLRIFELYKQVPLGILFMLLMYVFYSTNLLFSQYAGYMFHSEAKYLSLLNVTILAAYLVCFPITGILLYRGVNKRLML